MKLNTVKIKIIIILCTLYGKQVYADTILSEELAKRIVKIQKTKPNIDPNSREGEKAYAEWTAKKNELEQQIDRKTISGTCIYRGTIRNVEDTIDCQAGNIRTETIEYQLCALKALDHKGAAVAQLRLSQCGPPSSSEKFSLKLSPENAVKIRKIYDKDKIKFTGIIDYCQIYYSTYANGNDVAQFLCRITNANAELVK